MRPWSLVVCLLVACFGAACGTPPAPDPVPEVATFSIVAFDPETGDLGVASQSKAFGVGSIVPYVRADVGAIATQAFAEPTYGPDGLGLLDDGLPAKLVVERLVQADAGRARRQLAVVDRLGRAEAFTGGSCHAWAGHVVGTHYVCLGNILAGEAVVKAMAKAYETTEGKLAERLVAALAAGQAAGGDKRGRRSATVMVARRFGGYRGRNDRYIDLRVEDHETPIAELARVLAARRSFLPEPSVPRQMEGLNREPRVGTSLRPSAREVWIRWKALHAHRDWKGIRAMCTQDWTLEGGADDSVAALEKAERDPTSPQALARRGVYVGTAYADGRAKLYFDVRGQKQPVMVLLVREKDGWKIVP